MMFGPIVDRVRESSQVSPRTGSIVRFIWHHQADTNDDSAIDMSVNKTRQLSMTYTVDNKDYQGRGWARITGVAPEEMRPWTSSSKTADGRALTAEVCNSTGAPSWGIADVSVEACARLAVYAHRAYGVPLKRATKQDPTGHLGHGEVLGLFGEGYATACPGNLNIDRILSRARELMAPPIPVHSLTINNNRGIMYIKGTTFPDVYAVFTDANGQPRMRVCGKNEASFAKLAGIVAQGDDPTLTGIAAECGYKFGQGELLPTVKVVQ